MIVWNSDEERDRAYRLWNEHVVMIDGKPHCGVWFAHEATEYERYLFESAGMDLEVVGLWDMLARDPVRSEMAMAIERARRGI